MRVRIISVSLLALVLSASACSSGTSAATPKSSRTKNPQDAALEFARCMRQNGIDMPDPQVGEGGFVRIGPGPGSGDAPDFESAEFEKAQKACGHLMDAMRPQDLSDEDRAERRDAALRFAQCMREHGVDMPDPGADGGIRIRRGSGPEREDPRFKEAEEACHGILEAAGGLHRTAPEREGQ